MSVCPRDGRSLVAGAPIEATEELFQPSADGALAPARPPTSRATVPGRPTARAASPAAATNPTTPMATGTGPPESVPTRKPPLPTPQDSVGRVMGNYRLLELIGKGGMGWVYRAEHIKLGRPVALKLLRPEYSARRDSVARFFQEARAVNRIRHHNIVDITDFVELDGGTTFIIMELLEGASLADLARTGTLAVPRALRILAQICDALGAAHELGIIHRDMKPDNVIVVGDADGNDQVKLLDFGVAKLLGDCADEIGWETKAGSVIGTPAYMSPEQAGGLAVDGRSDVYSVGAIMYEIFCGQPVFRARSFGEYVRKHLNEAPVPPRHTQGGAHIDARIERIILRCLEKDPDRRYPSARALRETLLSPLGIATIDSGVLAPDVLAAGIPPQETAMAMGDLPATRPGARAGAHWPMFMAAALGLGAVAGLAFFFAAGGNDSGSASRSPLPIAAAPGGVPTSTPGSAPPVPALSGVLASPLVLPPEAPPALVPFAVRFTSEPSASPVFAYGSSAPQCETPCDVTIDPDDGGSIHRRDFVVFRRGYHPGKVSIDPRHPRTLVHVRLSPESEPPPTEAGEAADDPTAQPSPVKTTSRHREH
jgi:serine/threonine-protein kinase